MRKLSAALVFIGSFVLAACAAGVSDGPSGNHPDAHVSTGGPDANFNQPADAPVFTQPDAFVSQPDAFVSQPDAMPNGLTCNSSSECDQAGGQCCFILATPPGLCVTGTEPIPGFCVPG